MEWNGKLSILVAAAALLGVGLPGASACGGGEELPVWHEAPGFALVDQRGDTLRTRDLRGQAWVVHVFFTRCRTVCPATTARMAAVRDSLEADDRLGRSVRLVSITVDPARDTPEVLRSWAQRHGAGSPTRWAFLRGTPPDDVRRLVQEGFRLSAKLPSDTAGNYQVQHSPRVLLVDRRGRVRGAYAILTPDGFRELLSDVRALTAS